MKISSPILLFLLLLLAPGAWAQASLKASLDSSFLVQGEQTRLTLHLKSDQAPTVRPSIPKSDNVTIQYQQEGLRVLPDRSRVYVYTYIIRSFKPGTHLIPAFNIEIGGKLIQSVPVSLRVAPLSELTWHTQTGVSKGFQYASAIFTPEASPYDGETFPTEIKLYFPNNSGGASSGAAELEHDGLVAWRFELVPYATNVQLPTGAHTGFTFRSTAAPIRSGAVSLGPGKARMMMRVRRSERGFTIVQNVPVEFELPQRTIQARPLPPGAPKGFAGAVGSFTLSALADVDELEEGDPIALRLLVSGTGNLDSLPAPGLDAPEGDWKIYEPSRLERQGERRDVTGTVGFSQIIRPLTVQDQVPPFELVYFNPRTATYATSRTKPIPFKAKASPLSVGNAAIIPTLATPIEDMQGILAIIDPVRTQANSGSSPLLRYWQVLPALLALALLFRIAQLRILPRFQVSERERQIQQSLEQVAAAGNNEGIFLRAAGAFVERWISTKDRSGELTDLLERRDTDSFRPDHAGREIDSTERKSILKVLKEKAMAGISALTLLATLFLSAPEASAAETAPLHTANQAYLEGNIRTALELYSSQPTPHAADLLYNIGNCHYKLNQPGKAALFYHRALLEEPGHPEAAQNLRFLERSLGAITIVRQPYETNLAKVSRQTYQTLTTAGAWLIGLAALALFALNPGITKVLASLSLGLGVLLTSSGAICQHYYPNDATFAPDAERGVITSAQRIVARTEASESSAKVIEAPPGSLCRLLAPRGTWTYLEFPNRSRAWVPTSAVSPLVPPATSTDDRL